MQKLFSYGTLQLKSVQIQNFGRILNGNTDLLEGYKLNYLEIRNKFVIDSSGTKKHPIITYSGRSNDQIEGVLFDLTEDELKQADKYEVEDYKRIKVKFKSGLIGWVYVSK